MIIDNKGVDYMDANNINEKSNITPELLTGQEVKVLSTGRGVNRQRNRIDFSRSKSISDYPDLLNIQVDAYDEFLQEKTPPQERVKKGLQQSFINNFPIVYFFT